MPSDHEIEELNSLVAEDLAQGMTPSKASERFHAEMARRHIPAEDITFGARQSDKPLDGHVLLGSSPLLLAHLDQVYGALSGTGAHYSGMWGDGTMLRNDDAKRELTETSRPAAAIEEQVVLLVRLLGSERSSLVPEVADAARRRLSTILLDYPVLLSPKFLIPAMQGGRKEYLTLAAALATSPHGALPRYAHFHPDVLSDPARVGNRDDRELVARLQAFARHPCVLDALIRAGTRVHADNGASGRVKDIKVSKELLIRTMLGTSGPRPGFLASVMEIEEAHAGSTPDRVRRPFIAGTGYAAQLDPVLAKSALAASGAVHTAPLFSSITLAMRSHPKDLEYLEAIGRRAHLLFTPGVVKGSFAEALHADTQSRVFLGRMSAPPPAEMALNVRAAVDALQRCGFVPDRKEALHHVVSACIGARRPDDRLPRAELPAALAFLAAVSDLGGFDAPGGAALLDELRADILYRPAQPIPFREVWAAAVDVFAAERAMAAVIEGVNTAHGVPAQRRVEPISQPGPEPFPQATSAAPPRRRRAAL